MLHCASWPRLRRRCVGGAASRAVGAGALLAALLPVVVGWLVVLLLAVGCPRPRCAVVRGVEGMAAEVAAAAEAVCWLLWLRDTGCRACPACPLTRCPRNVGTLVLAERPAHPVSTRGYCGPLLHGAASASAVCVRRCIRALDIGSAASALLRPPPGTQSVAVRSAAGCWLLSAAHGVPLAAGCCVRRCRYRACRGMCGPRREGWGRRWLERWRAAAGGTLCVRCWPWEVAWAPGMCPWVAMAVRGACLRGSGLSHLVTAPASRCHGG